MFSFCPGIPKTSFKTYSNDELNFFKFASIVLNEFPEALRQIFVDMWDKRVAPHHSNQVWDDSIGVHNLLLNIEGPKPKYPKIALFKTGTAPLFSKPLCMQKHLLYRTAKVT